MTTIKGLCTNTATLMSGAVTEGLIYDVNANWKQPFFSPLLTWADWELLQALHKERAEVAPEPSLEAVLPKPSADHLGREINALREQLKQVAAERDRALVQVTVYRKAYYNLRDVITSSAQSMEDAERIIHEAVKDHENQ